MLLSIIILSVPFIAISEAVQTENTTVILGIPYAKAPLRTLRFEDPQPLSESDIDAVHKHSTCPQFSRGKIDLNAGQSEDCLYISLFLPKLISKEKKVNILAFFHNHELQIEEFAKYVQPNLALAVVSFREGPFGFFRGQLNGIRDMQMAIRVLKEELMPKYTIGGRMTIIAEGDAASLLSQIGDMEESVQYDQAVFLNGNKYVERMNTRKELVERNSERLLRGVECDLPSPLQSLDCLRTKTIKELQEGLNTMTFEEVHGAPFQPLIQSRFKNAVPTIVSSQSTLQSEYTSVDEFDSSYSYADFKRFLAYLISENDFANAALLRRLALYEYVHARGEKTDNYFLFEQSRKMIADKQFYTKTFQYVMDLNPTENNVWLMEYPLQDAMIQCFFSAKHEFNEQFCLRFTQYIVRFSTEGQPTERGCDVQNPTWPALKSEKRDYFLVLKEDGEVEWDFDYHRRAIAFWDDLFPVMSKIELAGKRENPFEEVPDLTAYEEEDDIQLWHTQEVPDLTEEKALNDMPFHFEL
ncbi:hypothetical protein QR680_001553 [Steinernema hermaphroditum]|uniref:Carboxylesterase type B domain-containing protein n=1 Tax=Steinernema hermaphroditum TaxID=289476 RepID=A0AA39H0F1_9BILA|nr:hypothetical protein QR680_001553 [Steinernema hermaphroditum]